MITLEEKDHFESLAIEGSESEQNQSPAQTRIAGCGVEQRFASAIMGPNPAAPVNFVEEPIHDHKQNDHCEQSGRGLQVQSRNVLAQLLHDSDRDEPGHKSSEESDRRSRHYRFAIIAPRTSHAGGYGSKNENAFESLAEYENTDIERSDGGGSVRLQRIGRTVGSDPLPDENRDDKECGKQ
jgi:hypothetical protein